MAAPARPSDEIDCLARTVWGEARGCGAVGMRHVASVIVNRVAHPRWWGNSVVGVCTQRFQFSCRNAGDPNLPALLRVSAADPAYAVALTIARAAVAGQLVDETFGADSYYALGSPQPYWIARAVHTMSDRWHAFYRVQLAAPSGARPEVRCQAATLSAADVLNQAELDRLRAAP